MDTNMSARLGLPLLAPGQAQKEMTHNEALALLDIAAAPAVEDAGVNAPPVAPEPGQCWIIGPAPIGAWAGQAHAVAGWTAGGWRFVAVPVGASTWNKTAGLPLRRTSAGWSDGTVSARAFAIGGKQVLGPRQAAVAGPAGGVTVDAEARGVIGAILEALRAHGLLER